MNFNDWLKEQAGTLPEPSKQFKDSARPPVVVPIDRTVPVVIPQEEGQCQYDLFKPDCDGFNVDYDG